jgi:Tfp pilus assembly protein PilX
MKTRPSRKEEKMKQQVLLNNEDGSIIVIVLIVLMLVTMMGVSSTTTSTIEIQIAGNEKNYKENFYTAEAAAMEAMQRMDIADSDALKLNQATTFSWMNPKDTAEGAATTAASSTGTGTYYATNQGFTTGTSLGMTGSSQLYTFEVHGIVDNGARGRSHIEVGYKRRF